MNRLMNWLIARLAAHIARRWNARAGYAMPKEPYYRARFVRGLLTRHQGWLRIGGVGIAWRSIVVRPLFHERPDRVRTLQIGPWVFRWMTHADQ